MLPALIPIALQLAGQFAPEILKHFGAGDDATNVAGKVIDIATALTGAPDGEAALAAIKAGPELAAKYRSELLAADMELQRLAAADRANARGMQIAALGQNDLFSKRYVYYFMTAWSLFSMIYIMLVTFFPPGTEAGKANAATILGFLLGTAVATMFAFLMGSTDGGKEKSKLLAQSAPPKG